MSSQIAPARVNVVTDGLTRYGEATERPIPDPRAMIKNVTALATNAPAMAALQENREVAVGAAGMTSISPSKTASVSDTIVDIACLASARLTTTRRGADLSGSTNQRNQTVEGSEHGVRRPDVIRV